MPLVGPDGVTPLSATVPQTQDQTPDEPPMPRRVSTAFLVYVEPTGRVFVTDDLAAAIVPSRKPSLDDIIGAAANVHAEVSARKTADMAAAVTVQTQLALQRQLQEAAINQQIQHQLKQSGK